jgi:hypothetical protein
MDFVCIISATGMCVTQGLTSDLYPNRLSNNLTGRVSWSWEVGFRSATVTFAMG